MSSQNSTTTVNLAINGQQAKETLNQLRQNAMNLETAIAKAAAAGNKADLKRFRKDLADTKKEIKQIEGATQSVEHVMRNLNKATPKELNSTLAILKRQLNNIERGSTAWNEHVKKIQAVKAEIASMNAQLRTQQGLFGRIGSTLSKWSGAIMGGMAATAGITMAVDKAVDAYAEQEKQLMNVTNTTALTGDALKRVNEELAKMQTTTSQIDLLKLAEEAGEMGYRTEEEVVRYVKAADQIKVAMSDMGEESVKSFAKIANIFDVDMLAVASAVDVLGQNCEASKADITAFIQGISGVGAASNMTVPELAAFSAVLQSNGQAAKNSSAVLSKLINDLNKDPGKFAKALGVSVDELNKKFENTTEGLVWFFDTLKQKGDVKDFAPLLDAMGQGGAKAAGVISTLASNVDILKQQISNANMAFDEAINVTNEYNNINSTFAAQQEMQKKRTQELLVALGEQLAPVVSALRITLNGFLTVIKELITFIVKYKTVILVAVGAITAYTVAINAAKIATAVWSGVLTVAKSVAMLFNAAILLVEGNTKKAAQAWRIFSGYLKANPIGLAVAAVTALALGIYALASSGDKAAKVQKELNKLHEDAAVKAAEEKTKIDLLVQAAENETLSLEQRTAAINKLNQIVPNYNAQLDVTTGKYKANKKALDEYITSLIRMYEVQGAKDKLIELGKRKAELKGQQEEKKTKVAKLKADNAARNAANLNDDGTPRPQTTMGANVPGSFNARIFDSGELSREEGQLKNINNELAEIEETEKAITKVYGGDIQKLVVSEPDKPDNEVPDPTKFPSSTNAPYKSATSSTPTKTSHAATPTHSPTKEETYLQKASKEHENNILRLQIALAKGEKSYDEYIKAMEAEDKRYYADVTTNTKVGEDDRLKLKKEALDKEKEYESKRRANSLEELEDDYKTEQMMTVQHYADGELTKEQYEETMNRIELEYLDRKRNTLNEQRKDLDESSEEYKKIAREYVETNKAYFDKVLSDQEEKKNRAKELAEEEAEEQQRILLDHQQQLQRIRDEYFGLNTARAKKEFDTQMALLDEQKAIELAEVAGLANADAEKLRIEEAYQKARLALMKKYNQIQQDDNSNFLQDWVASSQKWLESDLGQAVTKSLSVISNGMQSVFSQMSNIISAEAEIQTAKMEAYYERQLSLAEGNRYKEVQLEKEKKEKIAKIKSDAEKKKYKMEVIAAIAQTATAAINAYSSAAAVPLVGYILAPIAAATAIAAGMLQVQALKKQQQASDSQGYAEGGFTPEGLPNTPAGIVHAGEWVASQRLTRNPHVRPILEALDDVQRNNRIGTLNADYVTRTINAPTVLADSYQQSQGNSRRVFVENQPESSNGAISEYAEVIRQLKERLDEPFVTVNSVTGDTGMKQAQDEYDRLIRNKSPKSR